MTPRAARVIVVRSFAGAATPFDLIPFFSTSRIWELTVSFCCSVAVLAAPSVGNSVARGADQGQVREADASKIARLLEHFWITRIAVTMSLAG